MIRNFKNRFKFQKNFFAKLFCKSLLPSLLNSFLKFHLKLSKLKESRKRRWKKNLSHKNPFIINLILEFIFSFVFFHLKRQKKESKEDAGDRKKTFEPERDFSFDFVVFFIRRCYWNEIRTFFSFPVLYISFDLINSMKNRMCCFFPSTTSLFLPLHLRPLHIKPSSHCASWYVYRKQQFSSSNHDFTLPSCK